jgi:hypothetical protein
MRPHPAGLRDLRGGLLRALGWRGIAAVAAAAALVVAALVAAAGLFLILLPLFLLAGIVARLVWGRPRPSRRTPPTVIEGSYEVVEDGGGWRRR